MAVHVDPPDVTAIARQIEHRDPVFAQDIAMVDVEISPIAIREGYGDTPATRIVIEWTKSGGVHPEVSNPPVTKRR
jgi:hypothetical protein